MTHALPEQGRARRRRSCSSCAASARTTRTTRTRGCGAWSTSSTSAYADFLGQAYQAYSSANGLNPSAFKSLKRFETEIIAATAELLHGGPETCGVVTSGGTESCLLAVKTYRDLARAKRGVRKPEMVVPATAHVAWFKAASTSA